MHPFMRHVAALLLAMPSVGAAQEVTDTSSKPTALGAVVISATRTAQSIKALPSHVVVVGRPQLAMTSAQTVPEMLRRIPGFTTRDLQSGLIAGPSASIVSFRGLGGSSAGRALVLLDGLPAGDPFSGWLDWGRIPLPMLESAEVVRGGGSITWGSRSLGGIINLRTISPRRDEARLMIESGSLGTIRGAGTGTLRRGSVSATLGADVWQTDGFMVINPNGPADENETNAARAFSGKVTWDASSAVQAWGSASYFHGGELPLGRDTEQTFGEARGGLRWLADRGVMTAGAFTNDREASLYSYSYNSDRSTRMLNRANVSPARSSGLVLQWTQMAFSGHELTVGADYTSAAGSLTEDSRLVNTAFTRRREVSGDQTLGGVFLQDAAQLRDGLRMVASVRADRVDNANGRRIERNLETGAVTVDSALREITLNHLTWSLGLRWQQGDRLGWRASIYEAFRAPSMYEMYYPRFSSRGTVTEANSTLDAEALAGGEIGADLTLGNGFVARLTAFTNRVRNPIMDVTIGTAGAQPEPIAPCGVMPANQTCSQRQNLPVLRSNGIESEMEWQPNATWVLSAGYAFSPTRVMAEGHPVDGKQAIRSARHMVTSSILFSSARWASIAIDARYVGSRFDDDLNTVELDPTTLIGLRVNRPIGRGITVYVKIDNLLDEEFEVARTRAGLADMGPPRWITAGMRAQW
jgi:outer membrane cobalamin receptor